MEENMHVQEQMLC